MSQNKVVKPVAFNVAKPDDAKMLEFLKKRNFSGYVKKLIWQDIKSREQKKTHQEAVNAPDEPLTPAQKLKQMKSQLKDISGTKNQE